MALLLDKRGRTICITLDRPPVNVLNRELLDELAAALSACARDSTADFLVLRGAGRAFSAGVDIADHTPERAPGMLETVHGTVRRLWSVPQITIAVVRGVCLGGGCELATSCDLLLASEESSFATPEIRVGCFPPVGLARFPALIGYHRAAEMILTGRRISAQQALAMGLVNRVYPAEELDGGLDSLLSELGGQSGAVLRVTIRGLRELWLKAVSDNLHRSEAIYREELLRTQDAAEGIQAFLEKRAPRWSHR